jgi:hypothetical protein
VPEFFKNPTIINREVVAGPGAIGVPIRKTIPSWNTTGRPKDPKAGTYGFNHETLNLEFWDGAKWFILQMKKL